MRKPQPLTIAAGLFLALLTVAGVKYSSDRIATPSIVATNGSLGALTNLGPARFNNGAVFPNLTPSRAMKVDASGNLTNVTSGSPSTEFVKADGTTSVPGGSGDVVGPASGTDNAVVRFDGTTGKVIQDSTLIAHDDGKLFIPSTLTNAGQVRVQGGSVGGTLVISRTNSNIPSLAVNSYSNAAGQIVVQRHRDTEAAPSAIQAGDQLGQLEFLGFGASNLRSAFMIRPEALSAFTGSSAETLTMFRGGNNSASARDLWGLSPYNWTNYVAAWFASNAVFQAGVSLPALTASRALMLNAAGNVTNVTSASPTTEFVRADGVAAVPPGGGGATGADGQVQYASNGVLQSSQKLTYSPATETLFMDVSGTKPGLMIDDNGSTFAIYLTPRSIMTTNGSLTLQAGDSTNSWSISSASGALLPNTDARQNFGGPNNHPNTNFAGTIDTTNVVARGGTPNVGGILRFIDTAGTLEEGPLDLADVDAITGLLPSANLASSILKDIAGTGALTNLFSPTLSNASIKPLVVGVGNAAGATNTTGRIRGLEAGSNITLSENGSNIVITGSAGGSAGNFNVNQFSASSTHTNLKDGVLTTNLANHGWLTTSNMGVAQMLTNGSFLPTIDGTNVILNGLTGSYFRWAGWDSTNYGIWITNLSVGQSVRLDVWLTNGSRALIGNDAKNVVPGSWYYGGDAMAISSNCWSSVIFTRLGFGANDTNIIVITKDLSLGAAGGLVLHTNFATGLITVSNSVASGFTTNSPIYALGYVQLTNQIMYGQEDINGATSVLNLDFLGAIVKTMTNAISGNRTYNLTNAAGGLTMVVHINGETATATDRQIYFYATNTALISWRSPTNGNFDFIAHSNQNYTVFFTVKTNATAPRTNIVAQWSTDSQRPLQGTAFAIAAGAGTSNAFVPGHLWKSTTSFTNWNASTLTNLASVTIPGHTLTNVNDELVVYAYGKIAATVGTNKWVQLQFGSSTNLIDTGFYPMSNGTWRAGATITRTGNAAQSWSAWFAFPHGTTTNFSGTLAETNGINTTLKLMVGCANASGGFTNEYMDVKWVPGYR